MPSPRIQGPLVIAGATGALGTEVVRVVAGLHSGAPVDVLAREPITPGLRGMRIRVVEGDDPAQWPRIDARSAIVMFDPLRLFYQRERALWTPLPGQLPALARWLRESGVTTLAVVMPHVQTQLPDALKRGLANLDEHTVAQLRFDRLLVVRSARKPATESGGNLFQRVARLMLSIGKYMVPSSEQPVRAATVARFVAHALEVAPPGIHVAAPETVWEAAQGDVRAAVVQWLAR